VKTRDEVSAGGVVFRERADGGHDVAIILTHEGRWQLPKGWVEAGEAKEETARREVREEAGVEAEVIGELGTIEYWFVSNYEPAPVRVHKRVHVYLLRCVSGSPEQHDDEVADARWLDIAEAERMLAFKDERRMIALAREALARAVG
jgi:8-oxo-dGTP pyrophosphatase MutT (NUDIX family)